VENAAVDEGSGLDESENDFPDPADESTDEKEEDVVEDFG